MKYWIFYDINGDIYAITNNKEISKSFMEYRCNTYFTKVKRDLTYDESRELIEEYAGCLLSYAFLKHYDFDRQEWRSYKIALTQTELITVEQYGEAKRIDLQVNAGYNPYVFKKEIIEALKIVRYLHFYEANQNTTYVMPLFKVDTFNVFVLLYGHTLFNTEDIKK